DFKAELYLEKYVELVALSGRLNPATAVTDLTTELDSVTNSCGTWRTDKKKEKHAWRNERLKSLLDGLPASGDITTARKRYRNKMALAAECMSVIQARWETLQKALGNDIDMHGALLSEKAFKDMHPAAALGVKTGLAVLPLAGRLSRTELLTGLTETAGRQCGYAMLQASPDTEMKTYQMASDGSYTEVTITRMAFCKNVYTEYRLLDEQRRLLYESYPILGEHVGARDKAKAPTVYENLAAARGVHDAIKSYNLDFNAGVGNVIKSDGNVHTCMEQLRKDPADAASELIDADPKALAAVDEAMGKKTQEHLNDFRARIRKLCEHPPDDDELRKALADTSLLSMYYNCTRPRYPKLADSKGKPVAAAKPAVSADECVARQKSTWALCNLYAGLARDKEFTDMAVQGGGEMFSMAMDIVMVGSPVVGGTSFSLGKGVVGAAVGGTFGAFFSPNTDSLREGYMGARAEARAGFAPQSAFESAYQGLIDLDEHASPKVKAIIEGALTGLFAGFQKKSAGATYVPKKLDAKEAASQALASAEAAQGSLKGLLSLYERLLLEGAFEGTQGAKVRQALEEVIGKTLEARGIPTKGLSLEARVALLREPAPAVSVASPALEGRFNTAAGVLSARHPELAPTLTGIRQNLTGAKLAAIEAAHEVGAGKAGKYTVDELAKKARILRDAGFTKPEREALLRGGVCGDEARVALGFQKAEAVGVLLSSYERDANGSILFSGKKSQELVVAIQDAVPSDPIQRRAFLLATFGSEIADSVYVGGNSRDFAFNLVETLSERGMLRATPGETPPLVAILSGGERPAAALPAGGVGGAVKRVDTLLGSYEVKQGGVGAMDFTGANSHELVKALEEAMPTSELGRRRVLMAAFGPDVAHNVPLQGNQKNFVFELVQELDRRGQLRTKPGEVHPLTSVLAGKERPPFGSATDAAAKVEGLLGSYETGQFGMIDYRGKNARELASALEGALPSDALGRRRVLKMAFGSDVANHIHVEANQKDFVFNLVENLSGRGELRATPGKPHPLALVLAAEEAPRFGPPVEAAKRAEALLGSYEVTQYGTIDFSGKKSHEFVAALEAALPEDPAARQRAITRAFGADVAAHVYLETSQKNFVFDLVETLSSRGELRSTPGKMRTLLAALGNSG
ncbi:MAG: hypothetical protein HY075_12520, partial [Deltaproteobacteria bacterium]|nr:hypothetical protein [Deltaproteobacteria bacterium]